METNSTKFCSRLLLGERLKEILYLWDRFHGETIYISYSGGFTYAEPLEVVPGPETLYNSSYPKTIQIVDSVSRTLPTSTRATIGPLHLPMAPPSSWFPDNAPSRSVGLAPPPMHIIGPLRRHRHWASCLPTVTRRCPSIHCAYEPLGGAPRAPMGVGG